MILMIKTLLKLLVFKGGELQTFVKDTQYNLINDTLAARTYDESGDYYVKPFEVFAKESLNDQLEIKEYIHQNKKQIKEIYHQMI